MNEAASKPKKGIGLADILISVIVLAIIGLIIIIAEPAIWNPKFMTQLIESGYLAANSEAFNTVRVIWDQATVWLLILFLFALVWDIIDGIIRVRKSK